MIEMRMRKENCVQRTITQVTQKWERHFPFLLRMHPAIQHHSLASGAEIVTVGANFGSASKINKLQNVRAPCQPPAREQSANCRSNEESVRQSFRQRKVPAWGRTRPRNQH